MLVVFSCIVFISDASEIMDDTLVMHFRTAGGSPCSKKIDCKHGGIEIVFRANCFPSGASFERKAEE